MDNSRGGRGGAGPSRGRGGSFRRPWRMFGRGNHRGRGGGRGGRNNAESSAGNDNNNSGPAFVPRPSGSGGSSGGGSNEQPSRYDPSQDSGNMSPPPKRSKKPRKASSTVVTSWKRKLPGFRLYYPESPPKLPEPDIKIGLISDYLTNNGYDNTDKFTDVCEAEYFEVICEDVLEDKTFMAGWPNFLHDLTNNPMEVVNLWGAVMHKLACQSHRREHGLDEEDTDEDDENSRGDCRGKNGFMLNNVGRIHAGLLKVEPVVSLAGLSSLNLEKFITIRGQIAGAGEVQPVCLQMPFMCNICQVEFVVDQPHGIYTLPKRCGVSEECNNKRDFEMMETSENLLMMDSRTIKLQDVEDFEKSHGGLPRTIKCELTNGLVDQCNTGDTLTITGVLKMNKEFDFKNDPSLQDMHIEVIAMRNHKDSEHSMGGHWFTFSDLDYCAVREIFDTPDLFKLLVASLCESIFGHEFVKAALILSLFGGRQHANDVLSRRSDINILMVGDPGIGKSQMLHAVTKVAPRGVYVCGTGSTVAGLTVTMVKDGDQYSLEAGALVMSDKGVCCIDELDKMAPHHSALLEAMEQQSVSIAKSGVLRTLPARSTVIAAANPVGGHYDMLKSFSENVKISTPLFSRFDITFLLIDKASNEFDSRLGHHVLGIGSNKKGVRVAAQAAGSSSGGMASGQSLMGDDDGIPGFGIPLINRLKVLDGERLDIMPHELMRKYIAYARQYVHPTISLECGEVLKEYYLRLRIRHRERDSTPITTRQLESLIRLTEARAKLELREIATADDARDVLEIFESSLSSAFSDEIIAVSALSQSIVIGTPSLTSKTQTRNQAKRLVADLQKMAETQGKKTFSGNEIRQAVQRLKLTATADELIAKLNNECLLLMKGAGLYQLQTV